ncbi:MAG: hypothetical protein CL920_09250 [Deltaproteobacteria bacterium]|nr:hypothetical protein [Deltaproteobacteria bacterium]|tara:strand:+ start:2285 stop:2515 length:231 start_codon:yes stop_codon:yes gene_type:complete
MCFFVYFLIHALSIVKAHQWFPLFLHNILDHHPTNQKSPYKSKTLLSISFFSAVPFWVLFGNNTHKKEGLLWIGSQ